MKIEEIQLSNLGLQEIVQNIVGEQKRQIIEKKFYFQVLESVYNKQVSEDDKRYKLTISDGHIKYQNVYMDYHLPIKKLSVIKAKKVNTAKMSNDQKVILLSNGFAEIVNVDEPLKMIGNPIDYDEYKDNGMKNINGANQLPKYPQRQNNKQMEMVVGSNNKQKEMVKVSNNKQNEMFKEQNKVVKQESSDNEDEDEDEGQYLPISLLTPVSQNWQIKARVTNKQQRKTFTTKKGGEGMLFSIDLLDSTNTEITCTFWNEGVNKFEEFIIKERIYVFSNGRVETNRSPKFNKPNQYVISFDEKAQIQVAEDDKRIQMMKVSPVRLDHIEVDKSIDICVVINNVGPVGSVTVKATQKQLEKRSLEVFDQGQILTELTIWGDLVKREFNKHDVLMIKDVRVSEFNGTKKLGTGFQSQIVEDLSEFHQAKELYSWFQMQDLNEQFLQGGTKNASSGSSLRTIEQMLEACAGLQGEGDKIYTEVIGVISHLNTDGTLYYLSCPVCMKKVEPQHDSYFCYKCNATTPCKPRYIFSCKFQDHTSSIWITFGDESGNLVLQQTAQDIMNKKEQDIKDQSNNKSVNDVISPRMFREYKLTLLSKLDFFNNQQRMRHNVIGVDRSEPNQIKRCKFMLNQIKLYSQLK